jgi:hypothetical protein
LSTSNKLKCKVDTACYTKDNSFFGVCIGNEHGQFLQAYTRRFQSIPTIAKVEATGMSEVLQGFEIIIGNLMILR